MTATEVIDAHTPSLSDENELELLAINQDTEDFDVADYALRTCACGLRIDGFYEYAAHLKDEIRKANGTTH